MNAKKVLSGHELTAKVTAKIEVTLPEIGYKDVFSNGSLLQQNQIETAIEARKRLIEVPRIEKIGTLSHAKWREELMLAEVTHQVGSHWQFLGHSIASTIYIYPEETLFLMETNCLLLKYNGVTVSLQQAYSLLLNDKINILRYKVYSSLSRLGYRVFRHIKNIYPTQNYDIEDDYHWNNLDSDSTNAPEQSINKIQNYDSHMDFIAENCNSMIVEMETDQSHEKGSKEICHDIKKMSFPNNETRQLYENDRLQKLKNRTLKPCNEENVYRFFENIPELVNKHIIFIKAPNNQYIPKGINLKKTIYSINLHNIKIKNVRSVSLDTNIYSANDEVNGSHIKRIKNCSTSSCSQSNSHCHSYDFESQNIQYRQFDYSRSRQHYNQINFGMLLQKHFVPNWFFTPRFQLLTTSSYPALQNCNNRNRTFRKLHRKRSRDNTKKKHFEEIKKIAHRLKQLILSGNTEEQNTQSLQNLIQAYNVRYKTKLRLSNEFNIIVDENILDTIELDDDDGPSTKKRRNESLNNKFDDNFNVLKKLAKQLKALEKNKKASGRHRRVFSKVLKTFNESYNEEYYLSEKYELELSQYIDLASSDSSSCIEDNANDDAPRLKIGKKLRNPFNILKRLSEKQNETNIEASTSGNVTCINLQNKQYSQLLLKNFTKGWLPPEDDFGRAEIVSKNAVNSELMDMKREQFLIEFLKIQTCKWTNWLELKKSFFTSVRKALVEFQRSTPEVTKTGMDPIIKPNDCAKMPSILQKLRIIQCETGCNIESNLSIDFDVFERDIINFRKTEKPAPIFRVVCIDERSPMPPGEDIAKLYSNYNDNVRIVFALVGIDSVTFLQITPNNIPIYISNIT